MNASRALLLALASLAQLFLLPSPAQADVRTLHAARTLPKPTNPSYEYFGVGVAIDGANIIVLASNDGVDDGPRTHAALLYRRSSSTGNWVLRRTLASGAGSTRVSMQNGIAAVGFGGEVTLFEYMNGDYVPARVAAPIRHPGGIAISGRSVLIGGDNCNYDAVLYEKGVDGSWGITGRLDDNAGACDGGGLPVELNYDYALVGQGGGVATAWRRNGTALDWVPAGTLSLPPGTPQPGGLYSLQGRTAVATHGGYVLRRSGTSTWIPQGQLLSVDHDNGRGGLTPFGAVYRDGVLVAREADNDVPRLVGYLETSPGHFEHFASLILSDLPFAHAVSGRTVVSVARNVALATPAVVEVFTLPTQLRAPQPVVNDFEDRDVADFTFNSGQFAVATRGTNEVLTQGSSSTLAIALLTGTDWTDYQSIEADITPTFGVGDSWVGLIVRYVDANNYYFAAIRSNATYGIYKRVNGANTLLGGGAFDNAQIPSHATLLVDGNKIFLSADNQRFAGVTDNSLTHGRAGLATGQARADFDDVHVTATEPYPLFYRDWSDSGSDFSLDLTTAGGDWRLQLDGNGNRQGMGQFDTSGSARAFIGTPVGNQEIAARVRLDAFGASQQGAWFGLLARYVDAGNHYYVTVRSTGQIQIRKIVNGVITVLASTPFRAVPGQYHDLRFRVINDQLQLFVDDALLAGAHDTEFAAGQYGMATYRAATTWNSFGATQP